MKKCSAILFAALFLYQKNSPSQPSAPAWRQAPIPVLGSVGFSSESIFAAAEDRRGLLWLGYTSGLYKYDGNRLGTFQNNPSDPHSITFGQIQHLIAGRDGRSLWLGSRTGGISRFDLETETAQSFRRDAADSTSLAGNEIGGIFEDDDGLWVGTNQLTLQLLPKNSTRFRRFPAFIRPGDGSRADAWALGKIIADPLDSDVLWVGSRFGVYRFEKKTASFRLFPFEKPVAFNYDPSPQQIWAQPDGAAVWSSCLTNGLVRFDARTGQRTQFARLPMPLPRANEVRAFWPISDSLTLVVMVNERPWAIHLPSVRVEFDYPFDRGNELFSSKVFLFKDSRDQIWAANPSRLFRMTREPSAFPFEFFSAKNPALGGWNNWQRAALLSPDGRRAFFGTLNGNGLLIWDLQTDSLRAVPWKADPKANQPDVLMDALCWTKIPARLWIASEDGLLFYEDGKTRLTAFRPEVFQKTRVKSLAAGQFQGKNCLWLGTKGDGLYRIFLDEERVEKASPNQPGEPKFDGDEVQKLLFDHAGRLWLAAADRVSVFNPEDGTTRIASFFNNKKWTDAPVSDLKEDTAGRIWISTLGSGLFLIADPSGSELGAEHCSNDVPGCNVIYNILPVRSGEIWASNDAGHSVWRGGRFVNYVSRVPGYGAMLELPDGSVVYGSNRGFGHFIPERFPKFEPPRPYLRGFEVFGKKVSSGSGPVLLDYRQNHFAFELGAVDFGEAAEPSFEYKLEGHEAEWISTGGRDRVEYTNLPDGHYRFWLRASNRHGIWSRPAALLDIEIKSPFWKRWWFVASILGLFSAVFYQIWKERQRKQRAAEVLREKERLVLELDKKLAENQLSALRAQMNPHFLFNCLNSVNWFLLKDRAGEASTYLTKFSRLMRLILDHSRSERIPLADEIGALRLYLEMESLRFENEFEWKIEVESGLDDAEAEVPPMLLQPFVENSIWHGLMPAASAKAGRLGIRFYSAESGLVCEIEDNGVGRNAAPNRSEGHRSHGLNITVERLESLTEKRPVVEFFDLRNNAGEATGTRVLICLGN